MSYSSSNVRLCNFVVFFFAFSEGCNHSTLKCSEVDVNNHSCDISKLSQTQLSRYLIYSRKMGIFINGKCRSKARLDDKTAIVTGCNTGIGKYTVMDLCRRGARVVMACRNLDKAEEAAKQIRDRLEHNQNAGKISIKHLDLSSLSSVRTCAGEILREEPCIHLLINNAGVMMCPHQLTEDGYEYQLATNHLGHFLFTLLLLPRILNSAPARVVNLSSMAHLIGSFDFDNINKKQNSLLAYARSKLSNILFSNELARRLKDTGVTVYSVHPGIVDTELDRHFDATIFSGSKAFLRSFGCLYKKTVKQGAQTTLYCALDEKTANETGLYYSDCEAAVTSPKATDPKLAKQLWDLSLQMVHWDHNTDPFKQG